MNCVIALATADLPRLCKANDWRRAGEPRDWEINEVAEDTIVISCVIDVLTTECLNSYAALIEAPIPLDDFELMANAG